MVAQVGALRVAVGADITGLQTGMKRAEQQVQKSAGIMQRAVGGINKSFSGIGSIGGLALGGAGLLVGARAFLSVADAAKTMTAQLRLATAEYGSFEQAQKDVRAIAEDSRSSLTATAELYSAIQRNAAELGNTQAQTARITETVSKSFAVFGTTAMQAEQATRQLIQAFQSGRLQGDEFRSLMENAPRLIKMLSESLGVTTGKLREMSKEGELTSDKLVAAFSDLELTAELDKEFAKMPVTFSQAMTQLYNSALITFSAFDAGGQFSNSIANFVTQGSTGFADLEDSAFRFGRGVADLFTAIEELRFGLGSLHTDGISAFGGLIDMTFSWRDALSGTLGVIDGMANAIANLYNAPGNLIRSLTGFGGAVKLDPSNMRGSFLQKVNQRDTATARRGIMGRGLQDMLGEFGLTRNPPPFRPPPGKAKKAKSASAKKPPRDRSEDVEFQFEQELRQAQMDILRAQQELAGTFSQRSELSLKMLDLEGQQFEAELDDKVRRAKRDLAEGKITESAFKQVEAHAQSLRAKYDETDLLKRQLIAQEAILHRKEREAALIERNFEDQLEGLRFNDEMAATQAEHRRIQLEIIDTLYRQKEAHLRALKAQLEFAGKIEEAADVQAEINRLPTDKARDQERTRRGTRGPMEDFLASVPDSAAKMEEALQRVKVNGIDALTDGLVDAAMGVRSLGDVFRSVAQQILADLLRIQIQKLIVGALGNALGGLGGASTAVGTGGQGWALGGFTGMGSRSHIAGLVHKQEFVLNAEATRRLGVPSLAALNRGAPMSAVSNDNGSIGTGGPVNIYMSGPMSDRQARQTGMQAAAAYKAEIARSAKAGF